MTFLGLSLRNMQRNRARFVLTVLGVAVTILTFVLLRTIVAAWSVATEFAVRDRLVTRHKMTFVMTLPRHYYEELKQMPGVRKVSFATWFGGQDPNHETEFFGTLAVDGTTYFDVYSEIQVPDDQRRTWLQNRQGIIVGDVIAKKLGWKLGDRIQLRSGIFITQPLWEFTVDGIYTTTAKSVDRSTVLLHWDYVNDALPQNRRDEIGWLVSRVDDPARAADTALAIDRRFDEKETPTLSQDEKAFNQSFMAGFASVLRALDLISGVILAIMALVLGNTVAMGVRERTAEYGAMRAIGFLPVHLVTSVVLESLGIALVGAAVGLGLSFGIIQGLLSRWIEENMGAFFPWFRVDAGIAVMAVVLSILIGSLAAALPAYGVGRLKVVDALRRVA